VSTGALVTVLVLGGVMAAIFVAVLLVTRRLGARAEASADAARGEAESRGEQWLVRLEGATFRGARHAYGRVKGRGVLGLTDRRLVFVPIAGDRVGVPVVRVTGVRLEDHRSDAASAHPHRLVLTLDDENELTFLVADREVWAAALAEAGVAVTAGGAT
jgi:hypothetical protein